MTRSLRRRSGPGSPLRARTRLGTAASIRAVFVTLLLTGTLAACQDDAPTPAPGPTKPAADQVRPDVLQPDWEAQVPNGVAQHGRPRVWSVGKTVVVVGARHLAAYGVADGRQRWQARLPQGTKGVCSIAETPNRHGVGAVVLQGLSGCGVVAAVDLRRGRFLWKHTIRPVAGDDPGVALTDKVVTAIGRCDEVHRYAVKTGRPLASAARPTKACANEAAVLGGLIAVKLDRGKRYGSVGKSLISPKQGTATMALLDADTLKRRWQVKVPRDGAAVNAVVETEPVVLDRSLAGHRMLEATGPKGGTVRTVGWGVGRAGFTTYAHAGGVLLGAYGEDDTGRYAFDLGNGKQVWADVDDASTVTFALHDGSVLRARVLPGEDPATDEIWIAAHPLHADAAAEVQLLGRFASGPNPPALTLVGRRVLALSGTTLTAVSLPAEGRTVAALPASRAEAQVPWTVQDIRPETAHGACRAVSPDSLARLGLRGGALPNPADCSWQEKFEPTYVDRSLQVNVRTIAPRDGTTGADGARAAAEKERDRLRKDGLATRAVEALGDAAWFASRPTSDGTRVETAMVAVTRNVVVTVRAEQQALLEERYPTLATPDAVDRGTREATADVLRFLGATPGTVKAGADGPATAPAKLCTTLARDARRLVPAGRPTDTTADSGGGRLTGCSWGRVSTIYPYLTVTAYAAPGSAVTGDTGTEVATAIFAGDEEDTPVPGVGDEADVWGFRQQGGKVGTRVLTARQGNLLVSVRYGAPRPDAVLLSEATKIAQKVLAAGR